MDHYFVLNKLSFPAGSKEAATGLLIDAARGMLQVGIGDDRYALYADVTASLSQFVLAPGFSYGDFLEELTHKGEQDLQLALLEIEDKSPALDFLTSDEIDKLASECFYFPDAPYDGSVDTIALAWHLDAALLSIATSDRWLNGQIEFLNYVEGKTNTEPSFLNNVSCRAHGVELGTTLRNEGLSLSMRFPECRFSAPFLEWERDLPADLRRRVGAKFALANAKQFQGGEPLFKTLKDAEGMRELRFSAVQGGAVRIIFSQLADRKQAILIGFVKKSDSEGYSEAIPAAKELLNDMRSR
ncbi:type II toxin-antitoxin system RelE/ParE family toxin [Chromobacterium sp. ASV23]|uniref:type II toxin-antitoxin system RelE/ParE family toxin n=1 Tax=Chromobacterium sp. ASV23 TaxID=2795110 RepID=UPI0018EA5669|nr:type II toxin-antitoxin system RelE/ParE family toxin [Chromobacterium sp. ASV23]